MYRDFLVVLKNLAAIPNIVGYCKIILLGRTRLHDVVQPHVVINRPPSGGNSLVQEWCRNADVWCILYVFGQCPQQNKEIEADNVITNDYM